MTGGQIDRRISQVANPGTKDFFARLTIVPRKEGLEVVFFPYIFFYPVFFS